VAAEVANPAPAAGVVVCGPPPVAGVEATSPPIWPRFVRPPFLAMLSYLCLRPPFGVIEIARPSSGSLSDLAIR
jgi:hypothetical protein